MKKALKSWHINSTGPLPFPRHWRISQNWSKRCSWCHFSQTGNGPLQRDNTPSKATVGHLALRYGGDSSYRKSKQRLGSDNDERFAKVTNHLSPQQVEILSRAGGVDHSHVDSVPIYTLLFTVTHLSEKNKKNQSFFTHQRVKYLHRQQRLW